jgi:hypothetical protein
MPSPDLDGSVHADGPRAWDLCSVIYDQILLIDAPIDGRVPRTPTRTACCPSIAVAVCLIISKSRRHTYSVDSGLSLVRSCWIPSRPSNLDRSHDTTVQRIHPRPGEKQIAGPVWRRRIIPAPTSHRAFFKRFLHRPRDLPISYPIRHSPSGEDGSQAV